MRIVIFPDRGDTDQCLVRVQRGERPGHYLKHVWPSAEAAQEAVERAVAKLPAGKAALLHLAL